MALIRPPFSWFGSKARHRKFLTPLLPDDCYHFVDVFGGSASVILSRDPVPIETYNDLNMEVVNFFDVLRDHFDEFERAMIFTPFSRTEFDRSKDIPDDASDIERARLFFFRASVAYAGRSGLRHCYFTTSRKELRRGIPDRISRYLSGIENLPAVANRMKLVQIENRDAIDCIRTYDAPTTLFYCDPPYPHHVRKSNNDYDCEIDVTYHRMLAQVLNDIEGRAAISSYDSRLYDTLYSGWQKHVAPVNYSTENHSPRQEIVWTNYDTGSGELLTIRPTVVQKTLLEV